MKKRLHTTTHQNQPFVNVIIHLSALKVIQAGESYQISPQNWMFDIFHKLHQQTSVTPTYDAESPKHYLRMKAAGINSVCHGSSADLAVSMGT